MLDGSIEFRIGDPVAHRVRLNKWDCLSCPPKTYRGFSNVGETDAVLLTVISGPVEVRDDVSMPHSVAQQVEREHGAKVLDAFKTVFHFNAA